MTSEEDREANLELLQAVNSRVQSAFEDMSGAVVTRLVVIAEAMTAEDNYPHVCQLTVSADGEGLPRWMALGLMRAASINSEYLYTHENNNPTE
jgi:hypothetical protein